MSTFTTKCKNGSSSSSARDPLIDLPMVQVTIENKQFFGMFDSTSKRTLAGLPLIQHLRARHQYATLTSPTDAKLYSRYGEVIPREEAVVRMSWPQASAYRRLIYIPELTTDLILGRDFMRRSNIILNFPRGGWSYTYEPTKVYTFEYICECCNVLPNWRLFIKKCNPAMLAIDVDRSASIERKKRDASQQKADEDPEIEIITILDDPDVDPMEVEILEVEGKPVVKEKKKKDANGKPAADRQAKKTKLMIKKEKGRTDTKPRNGKRGKIQKIAAPPTRAFARASVAPPEPQSKSASAVPAAESEPQQEEVLRGVAQKILDEINHIYEVLEGNVSDQARGQLNQFIKRLLVQYRAINLNLDT